MYIYNIYIYIHIIYMHVCIHVYICHFFVNSDVLQQCQCAASDWYLNDPVAVQPDLDIIDVTWERDINVVNIYTY